MFTYLHCYMPQTWEAQLRAGLIRPGDGIRFCQSLDIDEPLKFNNLAAVGGELYSYVKEHRCPLYIDRLQGGCFLEEYPYDMALVNEYRALLGEKFWGFQMHEWGSNLRSDFGKITSNNCPAWTVEAIEATIRRAYPYEHTFVEAMNVEEYASLGGVPKTYEEYLSVMQNLFAKRQAYVGGDLLPCDSYFQAQKMEIDAGAKRLMPEIGAQTPNTRIQVAYARGMARAAGIPFGTYYEPWGGSPFSACCYQCDGKNEWNITGDSFPFKTAGGNGGSSRSMQWRMHLYSYMAGASFMAEEWGMCNTFFDWDNFELTPYGQTKKDFLDFVDRYPAIGEPVIPVAVVLPKDMPVLDMALSPNTYLGYPVEGQFAKNLAAVVDALTHLFVDSAPMLGSETTSLRNYMTPDAIDIIHEDSPNVWQYPVLVDCTGNPEFYAAHKRSIESARDARMMMRELLPIRLMGGASMQITRNRATGEQYVLLMNNSGVVRSVADGETLLPEGDICVGLTLSGGKTLCQLDGNGSAVMGDADMYHVTIPSGGWFFAKF
ncbi:MAG: hypothetical protein E7604_08045 [Ruminococcaceae bacterium]|nr:hypothetical protein [Oscillospiraceae bacterium]